MTRCRLCGSEATASVVDLGATPPCESFLAADQLDQPEPAYPLHLRVCTDCWLAQIPPLITPEETFNEYAHFSDVVGFTRGLRTLVADDGWVSIEVQHLLTLIEENQYDTIYHEHFQYYTVASAIRALASGGLALVDVELLPTHGGSIRLWARPTEVAGEPSRRVADVLAREKAAGLQELSGYTE